MTTKNQYVRYAPKNSRYLVAEASDRLENSRMLAADAPVTLTDGGAGDELTVSVDEATATTVGVVKLAGQLGGLASSPDVRGLRITDDSESGGPQLLTLGAVDDGDALRRVGSTLVGSDVSQPRSFCDETDGDITLNGTEDVTGFSRSGTKYTALRPVIAGKMSVTGTARVRMANHTLTCRHLDVAVGASVDWDGDDAAEDVAGGGFSATGEIRAATGGGAAGRNDSSGVGAAGSGSGGDNLPGTSSGAGGDADGTNTGGAGDSSSALSADLVRQFRRQGFSSFYRFIDGTSLKAANGGGGGGSGGCTTGTGVTKSGGGGAGGGIGVARVGLWDVLGRVTARGGNGGDAAATGDGKGGGGGGGAGGALHIEVDEVKNYGTVDADGGTGGSGIGGGGGGADGDDGWVVFLVRGRPYSE